MYLTVFTSLFYVGFSFPQFDFSQTDFSSGQVDIVGTVSSGTSIRLEVNDNLIGEQDIIGRGIVVNLTSDVVDVQVPIGSVLIFENQNPSANYTLNFSTGDLVLLKYGDRSPPFQFYQEKSISYIDEESNRGAYIDVVDMSEQFNFTNIDQFYLNDGQNIAYFQIYSLQTGDLIDNYTRNFNYNKYSNNIEILNYTNISRYREVYMEGRYSDPNSPLTYIVNHDERITNVNLLQRIETDENYFNLTVDNLKEGNNTIRFISLDPQNNQIFNGESEIEVLVDTIKPDFDIISATYEGNIMGVDRRMSADMSDDVYLNGNTLNLNISTDGVNVTSVFNGRNETYDVNNRSVFISLNLREGQNNLTLIATDIAGNQYKEAHAIWYDGNKPQLEEVSPDDGDTVHFFLQDFKGKVNKAGVKIRVFTIPEGAEYFDPETDSTNPVTCSDYEFLGIRDLNNEFTDDEDIDSVEINPTDVQFSLTSFISGEVTARSNSNGKFEINNVVLQEKSYTSGDVQDGENPHIESRNSDNTICFVMSDKYGNVVTDKIDVTLDSGNTMWKPTVITPIPNMVSAAEIENTDVDGDDNNARIGVIAKFEYHGGGKVTQVNVRVSEDSAANDENIDTSIVSNEVDWMLDTQTGEMTLFFPVEIYPLDIEPAEYPESLVLNFRAKMTYSLDEKDIPIDDANYVYFKTEVTVDRPLDSTKWLTPNTIDKLLDFLNNSIDFTEKAVDFTQKATLAGVVWCTYKKFDYALDVSNPETDKKDLEEAKKELFQACDRIACKASPEKCTGETTIDMGNVEGINFSKTDDSGNYVEAKGEVKLTGPQRELVDADGNKVGMIESLEFEGSCTQTNGEAGVYMRTSSKKVKVEDTTMFSSGGSMITLDNEERIYTECVDPNDFKDNNNYNLPVNRAGGGNVCFQAGDPFYDETRCNFFNNDLFGEQGAGRDPGSSLYSAIGCGCITNTYSMLKQYLQVQEQIKGCLQQAKIGQTKGAYCERLLSIFVCDLLLNEVMPEVMRSENPDRTSKGDNKDTRDNLNFMQAMQKTDRAMSNRYDGTILTNGALQTDQLMHSACVAIISMDASILENNIIGAIEQNEVEPVFGPTMSQSNLQSYNPITGELAIRYNWIHGVVSGGQNVRSEYTLVCNPNIGGGQYCPSSYTLSDEKETRYTNEGSLADESVVYIDAGAKYWYNELHVEHTYTLNGIEQTKVFNEPIDHKGEVFEQCHFSAGVTGVVGAGEGAGFNCDTIFTDDTQLSILELDKDKSRVSPSNVFYPGNTIFANIAYDVRGEGEQNVRLYYATECPAPDGKTRVALNSQALTDGNTHTSGAFGRGIFKLFEVPEAFGADTSDNSFYTMVANDVKDSELVDAQILAVYTGTDDATELPSFNIDITAPSDISGVSGNLRFELVNKNAIEDDDETIPKYEAKLKIEYRERDENKGKEYRVVLKTVNKPENVDIFLEDKEGNRLKEFTDPKEQVGAEMTDKMTNVVAGQCNLYMRLLPEGTPQFSSLDAFKNYEVNGVDENGVLTSVETNEMITKSFHLNNAPSGDTKYAFDVVQPYDGQSFGCKNGMPLDIIAQSSDLNFKDDNIKADFSLSSNLVAGNLLAEVGSITDYFNSDSIGKIPFSNKLNEYTGALDVIESTFTIQFYKPEKADDGITQENKLSEKISKKLYITIERDGDRIVCDVGSSDKGVETSGGTDEEISPTS